MEFKPINTQEEFDERIAARLQRERDSVTKNYADYEQLKTRNTELETENNSLKSQVSDFTSKHATSEITIQELNSKLKGYETDSVKMRIAFELGLPYAVAGRLQGETEEDIRKDALNLKSFMGPIQTAPLASTEQNGSDTAFKELLNKL